MESIPQIFKQLDFLTHISIEYSSTLYSFQTMTDTIAMVKDFIHREINNRQAEMKILSTQQGIGIRKILFMHYQRILKIISSQHDLQIHVTKSIYEKQKAMENSLSFIKPIVKQIQHKAEVLDKQLIDVKDKIEKLNQKKNNLKNSCVDLKSFLKQQQNQAKSQIFQHQDQILQKFAEPSTKNSQSFSLFSPRKFNLYETQAQFNQAESFLQLKLQQVLEFMRIQKQLTERTIKKIFEILDQTMGKGLQKLQKFILGLISVKHLQKSIQIPEFKFKTESMKNSESSSSIDLSCNQKLEDLMMQNDEFEKFRFVRKRLYESYQSNNDDELAVSKGSVTSSSSQQFGISPTFKFSCPLIIDSVEEISQFITPTFENIKNKYKNTLQSSKDPQIFLFDSFCKENVNTINI